MYYFNFLSFPVCHRGTQRVLDTVHSLVETKGEYGDGIMAEQEALPSPRGPQLDLGAVNNEDFKFSHFGKSTLERRGKCIAPTRGDLRVWFGK